MGAVDAVAFVQGDDLGAQQVGAGGDVWDGDTVLAGGGAEALDGPLAVAEAVFGELDPAVAGGAGGGGSDVDEDGAVVRGVDDLVAGGAGFVVPFEGELVRGGVSGWLVVGGSGGIGVPCRRP